MFAEESTQQAERMDSAIQQPAPVAEALYPSSHISCKPTRATSRTYWVEASGTYVALCSTDHLHTQRKGGGPRSTVARFSRQSLQRLKFAIAKTPKDSISLSRTFDIRLSYVSFGDSPAPAKTCLADYRDRLSRLFGSDGYSAFWKQEYTKSGLWHVHIVLFVWRIPKRLATKMNVDRTVEPSSRFVSELALWSTRTWHQLLGWVESAECHYEIAWCEQARSIRGSLNYIQKGPTKGNPKAIESITPTGAHAQGRWWGEWGRRNMPLKEERISMTEREFQVLRRLACGYYQRFSYGGYSPRIWSASSGLHLAAPGADDALFACLKRDLEHQREQPDDVAE